MIKQKVIEFSVAITILVLIMPRLAIILPIGKCYLLKNKPTHIYRLGGYSSPLLSKAKSYGSIPHLSTFGKQKPMSFEVKEYIKIQCYRILIMLLK